MRLLYSIVLVLFILPFTSATTYYVSTNGNNDLSGSSSSPFRTLQHAANTVHPGDTVIIRAGTYNERVDLTTSGTVTQRITFQGETGAIIDGGDLLKNWSVYPGCAGVYYKTHTNIGYVPYNLVWNEKQTVWIDQAQMNAGGLTELCKPDGSYWDGRTALAGNYQGATYIRHRQGWNPDVISVKLSPISKGVITIDDASYITIRGLTLKNSYNAIRITGSSRYNLVENNILKGGYRMVQLYDGPSYNTVRANEITLNYIYDDIGHPRKRSQTDSNVLDTLRAQGVVYGMGMIFWDVGSGNVFESNHIYRTLGGVYLWGSAPDTIVRNNIIEYSADYAMVIHEVAAANTQIYDNEMYEYLYGIRFGPLYSGPVYVYRNKFSGESIGIGNSGDIAFSFFGTPLPTEGLYIYHNSFAGPWSTSNIFYDKGTNAHFVNNIFSTYKYTDYYGGSAFKAPSTFDYNWLGGLELYKQNWMGPNNVYRQNTYEWNLENPSFLLSTNSSARQIGIDVSRPWTVQGVSHPALPGFLPGYFSGSAPDAGAVQVTTASSGDPIAPTVSITNPKDQQTISGSITLSATASDNIGIVGVTFFVDGVILSSEDTIAPYSLQFDTTKYSNGPHSFTAIARDAAQNTRSSIASIVIANTAVVQNKSYNVLWRESAVIVDGIIQEYATAPSITLMTSSGAKAIVQLLYDAQFLYIGVVVNDTQINADSQNRDDPIWRDDSVEIFIDSFNDKNKSIQEDDYQFIVNTNNAIYDAKRSDSTFTSGVVSAVKIFGTKNNNTNVDVGYTIELAIPWSSLGKTVVGNSSLGFEIGLNDKNANVKSQVAWSNSDGGGFTEPNGWGEAFFSDFFVLNADVNLDGKINMVDLIYVISHMQDPSSHARIDVTGDGLVDVRDLIFIVKLFE